MTSFPLAARIGAAVCTLLVAVYALMSISFSAPPGGFKSATSSLRQLGSPYFSQSWNVFAPHILKADISLEIAAQWRDEAGELVESDWLNVTDLELAAVDGQPLPSRAVKQSWNLIRAYNSRFLELNDEQREYVQDTFIERDGDGGFQARPEDELKEDLYALGESGEAFRLLRYDYLVKEYATYLATAYFGEDIERVRWRIYYERPNDFAHRHDPEQQFEDTWRSFGWRQADDRIFPDALEAFKRLVERGGGGAR